jgi:hypothetical protein
MVRLLRTGSVGLIMVLALACTSTSTPNKTRVGTEGGSCKSGGGCDPGDNGAPSNENGTSTRRTPALLAGTLPPAQWAQTSWSAGNSFFRLYASQDRVFARIWDSLNGGRVFLTADGGTGWAQIGSADSEMDILSIVGLSSDILAGTWNGLYLSTTGGVSWNAIATTGMPADTAIWSVARIDSTLFAGTIGHIYKSSDNGTTWTEISSGILANAIITSLVANGSAILAGSNGDGAFITTNGGTSWTAVSSGLADKRVSQLAVMGTKLFAVTLSGLFVSSNNGTS